MLQIAYLLAKIGADTAENEQYFAEILTTFREVLARPVIRERRERHGGERWPAGGQDRSMPNR